MMLVAEASALPRPHSSDPGGTPAAAPLLTQPSGGGSDAWRAADGPLLHRTSPSSGAALQGRSAASPPHAQPHAHAEVAAGHRPGARHSLAPLEAGPRDGAALRRGAAVPRQRVWRARAGGGALVLLGASVMCTTLYTTVVKRL